MGKWGLHEVDIHYFELHMEFTKFFETVYGRNLIFKKNLDGMIKKN